MRRLLSFECEGAAMGASLDGAHGKTGILFVTGGTQTRVGSHRMSERLAGDLANAGHPCFRYDRRGVGDSEGGDPGWRGSGADIKAAAAAFRRECPTVKRVIGFGLCDGATALALFGAQAGVDGLMLTNPWLIESEADAPPAAAIRHHYRERLLSLAGWKKIFTGAISYRKLLKGVAKLAAQVPTALSDEVAAALAKSKRPVALILARGDGTAIAAAEAWASPTYAGVRAANPPPRIIESSSHTFAREGDMDALLAACLAALGRF